MLQSRFLLLAMLALGFFVTPVLAQRPNSELVARQVDTLLVSDIGVETPPKSSVPLITDDAFVRRVMLDLAGELPTPEELVTFTLDADAHKRARMVDQLLNDPRFGDNWARYWRDVILYRRTEERALLSAAAVEEYLSESLNENKSWDEIATDFITAEGDVREDGRTALIMAQAGQPEDTVAEISRIFMGIQIQCAQCHDHPTDRWEREQFHELAAFFPRVAVRPNRQAEKRTFLVTAVDFFPRFLRGNPNARFRGTAEHLMPDLENPAEPGEQMKPVFFATGDALSLGTRDADRRGALADWLTSANNEWFAKAYVNRIWAELVGEGFYEPVDDLGPDRECSAPQTLDLLADSFVASAYDVKWLFRTIMATDAYQRPSQSRRAWEDAPFQANANQRLRGDQLFNSLMQALGINEELATRAGGGMQGAYGFRGGPRTFFNAAFGYDPSDHRDEITGSVQQALLMMNSPNINRAMSANNFNGLGRMLRTIPDDQELIVELYLRTLARAPTSDEIQTCVEYLKEVGDRSEAFEDLQWSLVNSTEFLHRR